MGICSVIGIPAMCLLVKQLEDDSRVYRVLVLGLIDHALDWIGWFLAFQEGDLQFINDPGEVIRWCICASCIFSTMFWCMQMAAHFVYSKDFAKWLHHCILIDMLVEDASQVVLYAIVGAANASAGKGAYEQTLYAMLSMLQSLVLMMQKVYELQPSSRENYPGTGVTGTGTPPARGGSTTSTSPQSVQLELDQHARCWCCLQRAKIQA